MAGRSDLTIHQFRVLDAVVRAGSLTRAALTLDLPQPAISRMIARPEQEVGTPLLNRHSGGVTLTTAGERFHDNAEQAVRFHDLAIEEARALTGLLRGEVRVAAPDSVGGILFAPLVQAVRADHAELRIRTVAAQSAEIPAMLASGTIDVGLVADTHALPQGLREPLFREDLYLLGPKSAPELQRGEITMSDAAALPLVLNAMPGGFRSLIDQGFSGLGLTPNVEIEIDANNPLLELLGNGAGFGILPYSVVAAGSSDALSAARLIEPTLTRTLSLLTAPNKPASSVQRETIRQIKTLINQESARARWFSLGQA